MPVSYKDIKTDRQWSASIGMKEKKFHELAKHFRSTYKNIFGLEMEDRQKNSSNEAHFKTYEDLLFFILFSLKSGLTYDALGLVFGMTGGNAKNLQTYGLSIIKATLRNMSLAPAREFKNLKQFKELIPDDEPIIFDGEEQRIQRSVFEEIREKDYSGKKKISR